MPNILETVFTGNPKNLFDVADQVETRLKNINNQVSNLGGQPVSFGNTVTKAKNQVEDLTNSYNKLDRQLLTSQKSALALANNFNRLGQTGFQNESLKIVSRLREIDTQLAAKPQGSYLKTLENESISLKNELSQLQRKLVDIKSASQADLVNQSFANSSNSKDAVDRFNRRHPGADNNLRLSNFQKQNLSYQINDVLTGLASGQNPTQILAQQGGQIAQIFNVEQITAFTAKYAALVPILAVGAASIGLAYKITGDIRKEAERRLSIEEKLAIAYGKQVSEGQKLTKNYLEQSELAKRNFEFTRFLQNNNDAASLASLKTRKQTLEALANINSDGDSEARKRADNQRKEAADIGQQILGIEQRIRDAAANAPSNSLRLGSEGYAKQQEENAKAIERQKEAQEKFKKSVEEGKEKVKKLGLTINGVFDNLYTKTGANNPIYTAFNEGNKELAKLKEDIKSLPEDIQKSAIGMQLALNANNLFSANLQNRLNAIDLRETANNFRNPVRNLEADRAFRDSITNRYLQGQGSNSTAELYRKNYGTNLALRAGGADKLTQEQRDSIFRVASFGLIGNINPQGSTFNDLNQQSLLSAFARQQSLGSEENLSVQQRLQKRFDALKSTNPLNAQQKDIIDRQILSLSNGVDPNKLTDAQRNLIADAADRRAERTEKYQSDANALLQKQLDTQIETNNLQKRWLKIAEKEGVKAVIEIINNSNGSATIRQGTSATLKDVEKQYQ